MKNIKRKSLGSHFSMCVQPAFIIGTNNEDGTYNFAPITWVSVTCEKDSDYLLTVSMFGTKTTKLNVIRTGILSVNLVSVDMLELMDYFGTHHAKDGKKDGISYDVSRGKAVDVPVLDSSRWVYECEVVNSVETGDSTTFICRIKNVQIDESIVCNNTFDVDLTKLDPVIYSGMYHSIGKLLGKIGDFAKQIRGGTAMENIWKEMYEAARSVQNGRTISSYVDAGGVAAAVLSESGKIYTGVCIDTCSTLGICAERNAIFNMITNGEDRISKVLCIMGSGKTGTPCGACRELMVQLMPEDYKNIEIMTDYESGRVVTLGELTPEWWIK